jgi:hypothetical protein
MEFAGTQTRQESLRGEGVFAEGGDKVGEVETVLYDKATGKPEWLAVSAGPLGLRSRLAPFHGAERRTEGVLLPYSAAKINEAPQLEGDEISQETERKLAMYYGLQYSESRSPTGLAQGGKSRSGGQQGRRSQASTARSRSTRGRTSGRSRRSAGPTRAELYEKAKRLNIKGRSRMNKAQLERAVSGGRSQAPSKSRGRANPFEVQAFLEAVGYPASKRELIREAKEQGAHERVRSTLQRLPNEEFDTPAAVSEAIGKLA